MNGIIVIAHAPLASALRECVLHVFPDAAPCLQALDIPAQQTPEASLEQTISDLQNDGVEVPAGISEHPWGRVATFKDSEGNDVQLYEPPK